MPVSLEQALGLVEEQPLPGRSPEIHQTHNALVGQAHRGGRSLESALALPEPPRKADIFDKIMPDQGQAGSGDIFDKILPERPQGRYLFEDDLARQPASRFVWEDTGRPVDAPEQPPHAKQPTTLADVATAPFRKFGSELVEGVKQIFSPGTDLGPFMAPGLPQPIADKLQAEGPTPPDWLKETLNRVLGVGRVAGAIPSAVGAGAGAATRYTGEQLGVPEEYIKPVEALAEVGGMLATPSSVTNLPITAAQRAGRMFTAPAVTQATKVQTKLADIAKQRATAELAMQEAQANLTKATRDVDLATSKVAQLQGGQITTPFAASLSAPVTNAQAYSFLQAVKPGAIPNIPLTNLQKQAEEILARFSDVPKPLQPSKVIKTAESVTGQADDLIGGVDLNSLTEAQKATYAPLLSAIKAHNQIGGLALDKLQAFKTSLGEMTNAAGGSYFYRKLYRGMMDDLRAAAKTNPLASHYLRANELASQNLAAAEIADLVTYNGTLVDKLGRLQLRPGNLLKMVQKDELLAQLPLAKQQEFIDTINNVFRANRQLELAEAGVKSASKFRSPALPEITSAQYKSTSSWHRPSRIIGGLIGSLAGRATGVPHAGYAGAMAGYAAGPAIADKLHQMIFKAALRPGGSQFLRTLYSEVPPMAGDTARVMAVLNFLNSTGGAE